MSSNNTVGSLLRDWRRRRRLSQLSLACDADISLKYLGSLETGRLLPTPEMVFRLADCLAIPLRGKNALLVAAGHLPAFTQCEFCSPSMASARSNIEAVLTALDPCPAVAIDRHWTVLSANRALAGLVAGAEATLLRPPFNLLRLCLHPAGLASRIVNLAEWRDQIIVRLRREIDQTGDLGLVDLLEEIQDYPTLREGPPRRGLIDIIPVATPLQLATINGTMSFYTTTTRFGTATDITLSELVVEAFMPADAETSAILRRNSESSGLDCLPPVRVQDGPVVSMV